MRRGESVCLSVYLSVCLSVCLSVSLSVRIARPIRYRGVEMKSTADVWVMQPFSKKKNMQFRIDYMLQCTAIQLQLRAAQCH